MIYECANTNQCQLVKFIVFSVSGIYTGKEHIKLNDVKLPGLYVLARKRSMNERNSSIVIKSERIPVFRRVCSFTGTMTTITKMAFTTKKDTSRSVIALSSSNNNGKLS